MIQIQSYCLRLQSHSDVTVMPLWHFSFS